MLFIVIKIVDIQSVMIIIIYDLFVKPKKKLKNYRKVHNIVLVSKKLFKEIYIVGVGLWQF